MKERRDMEEKEYLQHKAQTKIKSGREPEDKALLKCASEVQGLRRLERKGEAKRKLQDGIVFRVGEPGCTKLIYPDDLPSLAGKLGRTYNPLTKQNETAAVSDYVESKLHLEKTLVLWGAGGNQKTPSAEAIAKDFAIRYNTQYIKGNGPEALKKVQDEFDRLVPVIFEEFSADDVAQNGKKLSANYFKHLLDVRNGGQVRVRNVMLHFKPLQPRIICINDTPKEWLRAIEGVKDTDKLPLEKRVLFVHVDELVITPAAVAAYEADLDEIVSAGKRRRVEHYSAAGVEISSTIPIEEPSTSAGSSSVSGMSEGDSVKTFESLWSSDETSGDESGVAPIQAADDTDPVERKCQQCQRTLPRSRKGAVCRGCKLCPPGGNKGWLREQGRIDFLGVQDIVQEACVGNKWIKEPQVEHVSDFIAHLVAASYAKPSNAGRTPQGYDFLPVGGHEFPHPNGDTRKRTLIAKEIVDTLGPSPQHRIFGIIESLASSSGGITTPLRRGPICDLSSCSSVKVRTWKRYGKVWMRCTTQTEQRWHRASPTSSVVGTITKMTSVAVALMVLGGKQR